MHVQAFLDGGGDAAWVDTFPSKLSTTLVRSLVAKFKARYPSETLTPDAMPSARLMALVYKQVQDKCIRYVPWKWRLSEELREQQAMLRPAKLPRLSRESCVR